MEREGINGSLALQDSLNKGDYEGAASTINTALKLGVDHGEPKTIREATTENDLWKIPSEMEVNALSRRYGNPAREVPTPEPNVEFLDKAPRDSQPVSKDTNALLEKDEQAMNNVITLSKARGKELGEIDPRLLAAMGRAGVGAGTLNNAPAVGNPTKWLQINDNGTIRFIPAW